MNAIVKLQNQKTEIKTKTIKLPTECGPVWYEIIEKDIANDLRRGWFMKSVLFAKIPHKKTAEEKQKLRQGFKLRLLLCGPYGLYYVGRGKRGPSF